MRACTASTAHGAAGSQIRTLPNHGGPLTRTGAWGRARRIPYPDMLDSEGMTRRRKLCPINETRRPDGTLTSETARRLLSRRGGLARAKQQRADGYKMLAEMREKSLLMRSLKAAVRRDCHRCEAFAEKVLALLASEHPKVYAALAAEDRRLLDGVGPSRPRGRLI
jgi:hypothetical protein